MACISQNHNYINDKYLDMEFQICKDTGIMCVVCISGAIDCADCKVRECAALN